MDVTTWIDKYRKQFEVYEVPGEEREQLIADGEVGTYPGDDTLMPKIERSGRKEFDQLKAQRLDLTGQVKQARQREKELHPYPKIERFADKVLGKVPSFLSPDVPTPESLYSPPQPQAKSPAAPRVPSPAPIHGKPSRFTVEEGEIIDNQNRQIISPEEFDRLASPQDREALKPQFEMPAPGPTTPPAPPSFAEAPVDLEVPEVHVVGERPQQPHGPRSLLNEFVDDAKKFASDLQTAPSPKSLGEAVTESAYNFMQGLGGIPASTLKSIAIASKSLDEIVPESIKDNRPIEERATYKLGQAIDKLAKQLFPANPELQKNFVVGVIPRAMGSMTGFLGGAAAGALAKAPLTTGGLLGAQVGGAEQYEDASKHGASDAVKQKAFWLGSAVGVSEIAPVGALLNRFNKATGGGFFKVLREGGVTAAQEWVQEYFQQGGSNVVAQQLYDENRSWLGGTTESGAAGGVSGFITGLLSGLLQGRKARKQQRMQEGGTSEAPFAGEPPPPPQPQAPPATPDLVAGIPDNLNIAQKSPFLVKKFPSPSRPAPDVIVPGMQAQPEPMAPPASAPAPLPQLPAPGMEPPPIVPVPQAAAAPEPPPGADLSEPLPSEEGEAGPFHMPGAPSLRELYGEEATEPLTVETASEEIAPEIAPTIAPNSAEVAPTVDEIIQQRGYDLEGRALTPTPESVLEAQAHEAATSPTNDLWPLQVEPKIDQSVSDSVLADAKLFGDSADAQSLHSQGFKSLGRQRQHMVLSQVRRALNDREVLRSVIEAIPIDVMDGLIGRKWTPQQLLHDPSMLTHRLPVSSDVPVIQPVSRFIDALASAIVSRSATSATEKSSLTPGSPEVNLPVNSGSTFEASGRNNRHDKGNAITVDGGMEAGTTRGQPTGNAVPPRDYEGVVGELKAYLEKKELTDAEKKKAKALADMADELAKSNKSLRKVNLLRYAKRVREKASAAAAPNTLAVTKQDERGNPELDYSFQKRPTVKQIIADWKKAGKPTHFTATYGETYARFNFEEVHGIPQWWDEGNGLRGIDRNKVLDALKAEKFEEEAKTATPPTPESVSTAPPPQTVEPRKAQDTPTPDRVSTDSPSRQQAVPTPEEVAKPKREAIDPSKDTPIGVNLDGEKLYERKDGQRYRIRTDIKKYPDGYPDFGGDLSPVEQKPKAEQPAPPTPEGVTAPPKPKPVESSPVIPKQDAGSVKESPKSAPLEKSSPKPSAYALETIDKMYRKILDDTKVVHRMRREQKDAWATVKKIDGIMMEGQKSGLDYDEAASRVPMDDIDALSDILDAPKAKKDAPMTAMGSPDKKDDLTIIENPQGKITELGSPDRGISSKPTQATEEPSFKEWFSNSKIVDESGNPLVVYHGSDRVIEKFDRSHIGKNFGRKPQDKGFWFTSDKDQALEYASNIDGTRKGKVVTSAYLSIKNPAVWGEGGNKPPKGRFVTEAIANGHDGVIFKGLEDGTGIIADQFLVFEPDQIRPALGKPEGSSTQSTKESATPTPVKELADLFNQESEAYAKKKTPKVPRIPVDPIMGGESIPLSQIILDIEKGVGQKVTIGKPGRRLAGVYKPGAQATIIRYSGDLDTTAHEIAHALDDKYGLVKQWKGQDTSPYDQELKPFSEHSTPANADPTRRRAEGVAEFMRAWLVNPKAAEAAAPQFAAHMKAKLPGNIRDALKTFSTQVRQWAGNSAHAKIMANVEWETPETGMLHWLSGTRTAKGPGFQLTVGDQMAKKLTDRLAPFAKALDYVRAQRGEESVLPGDDPLLLARLYMGSNAKIDDIFAHGMIDARMERVTPGGLTWLLEPFNRASKQDLDRDMQAAASLMIAERTIEKTAQLERDRVTGIGAGIEEDVSVAKARIAELKENPEQYERIKEAASRYRQWADANLRYLVDKGRLSEEQYDAIKTNNEQYVAMQRILEISPGEELALHVPRATGNQLGSVNQPVQKFKGSAWAIKNPFLSLMDATNQSIREADRNEIMKIFRDALTTDRGMYDEHRGDLASVGRLAKEGEKQTIPIYVNGKKEVWQFHPDVYAALKGIGSNEYRLPLAVTILPRILRATIVNAPPFALRNVIRDSWHRAIVSLSGSKPWDTLKKYSKDEISALKRAGGDQAGFYYQDTESYARAMKFAMEEAIHSTNSIVVDPFKLTAMMRKGGKWYLDLMQASERQGRMAEYRRAFKKAKERLGYDDYHASLYAAGQSRSLIDYAVAGEWMQFVNQMIPFSNAAVQGVRLTMLRAKADPSGYALRFGAYAVLPALMTYAWNSLYGDGDDLDEYRQLPAYQRDLFHNFKLGPDLWLKLPKPFENGVLASTIERAIDYAMGNEKAFDGHVGSMLRTLLPVDEASFAGPYQAIFQAAANYDFFRDRPIVPRWEENLDLDLRHYNRASRLGQALQHAIGVDARKIDFVINQQFGYLGRYAEDLSDIGRKDRNGIALSATGMVGYSPSSVSLDAKKVAKIAEERGLVPSRSKMVDRMDHVKDVRENAGKNPDSLRYAVFRKHLNEYYKAESREERDRLARLVRDEAKLLRERWEKAPPREEATDKAAKQRAERSKDPLMDILGLDYAPISKHPVETLPGLTP